MPRVLVFSEARFSMDDAGRFVSEDPGVNLDGWSRELPMDSLAPVLVARARSDVGSTGAPLSGETVPLPHYVGLGQSILRLPVTWTAVRRAVRGADLVLVKVPGVLGTLATMAARRERIPVAAEVVGDAEGVLRSGALGTVGRVLRPAVGAITRRVVGRAGAVRYVTERELQRRYPPSADAEVAAFSDVVIADAPRWSETNGAPPHLVSVGSVDQLYKGHHHLIEALARIRDEFPDATLTVVGSGRRMPFLHETARERGVSDAVRFTGYLGDPAEVEAVLAEATLFVLPSLTEGMPRALIEAMAIGVPAIASRVGGVPELLPPSATFDPGDVTELTRLLRELHRYPERRREMSAAGIVATRRFSPSARAAALADWQRTLTDLAGGG